jgi:hypothetical protein
MDIACTFMVGSMPVDITTEGERSSVKDTCYGFMVGDMPMEIDGGCENHIGKSRGQPFLEEKQFWEGRTVMFLSK